jgi:hypothetical protein
MACHMRLCNIAGSVDIKIDGEWSGKRIESLNLRQITGGAGGATLVVAFTDGTTSPSAKGLPSYFDTAVAPFPALDGSHLLLLHLVL